MIHNHKYTIALPDSLNKAQRVLFKERVIDSIIDDIAMMWPSITLTESKDETLI